LEPPIGGGDINALWAYLPIDEKVRPVLLAWLVSCLMPDLPHPILALTGEHGSGKSTVAEFLGRLIDPGPGVLRGPPKNFDDWCVTAGSSYLFALDNLTHIDQWLSDALCRAVTGEALVKRKLYSDKDVQIVSFRRCVMITSIHLGRVQPDLQDRLLPIQLGVMTPERRRLDGELNEEFHNVAPALLGALLDLTVEVLRILPTVHIPDLPRMADFAKVLAAVDCILGTDGSDTYDLLRTQAEVESVEGDLIATCVMEVVKAKKELTVTTQELLVLVNRSLSAPEPKPRWWPSSSVQMASHLTKLSPGLRAAGLEVEHLGPTGKKRLRKWRLGIGGL